MRGGGGGSGRVRWSEEEWKRKWIGKSTFKRGCNSFICSCERRAVLCRKAPLPLHDPQPTHHRLLGNPKRQPKSLPVGGHVDLQASGILNRGMGRVECGRPCVVEALGARGKKLCDSYLSGFSECGKPNDIFWFP